MYTITGGYPSQMASNKRFDASFIVSMRKLWTRSEWRRLDTHVTSLYFMDVGLSVYSSAVIPNYLQMYIKSIMVYPAMDHWYEKHHISGHLANEWRCYFVTTSLIGWVQALNQPCISCETNQIISYHFATIAWQTWKSAGCISVSKRDYNVTQNNRLNFSKKS